MPQAHPFPFTELLASITDGLRVVVRLMEQTPETRGPIHRFLFPEKRKFLGDNEWRVDEGEECFICKEPLISKPATCTNTSVSTRESPKHRANKQSPRCYALRLWPCDHIIGDVCFKKWMSNPVNSTSGLCPLCQQPLLVAAEKKTFAKHVSRYISSWPLSALPDQLLHDFRDLRTQLATQSLQPWELVGPLMRLSSATIWFGRLVCIPLGIGSSGMSVKEKSTAFLRILMQPVVDAITWDLTRGFLRLFIYCSDVYLGR